MDERDNKALNEGLSFEEANARLIKAANLMSKTEKTDKLSFKEFIISKGVFDGILYSPLHKREFKLSELLHEYAVLFAKYHREQQIKAIIGYINDKYPNLLNDYMVHKEDLENAYSEDNIK